MAGLVITILVGLPVHAGWFARTCMRHLVAEDTAQFESVDEAWLRRRAEALEIRQAWGRLTADDQTVLSLVRRELEHRAVIRAIIDEAKARPVPSELNQIPGGVHERRYPGQT